LWEDEGMKPSSIQNFLMKALQMAIIADQAYAATAAGGASTLPQPNNFDALITEIATVFAPPPVA
jgi:hypothetical protein